MAFHVGQKVVCVDDSSSVLIRKGAIYTIRLIAHRFLYFEEPETIGLDDPGTSGWFSERFRPIVERKTDISIFLAMLTPSKSKQPERV